jgi:pyoverdine/dityrosine biosynthesis protein Dit1
MNSGLLASWVERAWNERENGYGFNVQRVEKYHFEAGVSFAEVALTRRKLKGVPTQPPSESFICQTVDKIVLGSKKPKMNQKDAEPSQDIPPCPELTPVSSRTEIRPTVSLEALNQLEHDYVYKGYLQALIGAENTIARKVYAILTDGNLCHESNKENVTQQMVEEYVLQAEAERIPLMFILPCFPFKDQNPFNTNAVPPWHVDFGDVTFLLRLHVLGLALRQVCPFGCEIIVLSDGLLYAPYFDISRDLAERYMGRIRHFRNFLNLQRSVHLLDLKEACHLIPGFDDMVTNVTRKIDSLKNNEIIAQAVQRLTQSMIGNLGWPEATREQLASIWKLMHGGVAVNEFEEKVIERARKCAINYLGVNVTISWLNVYKAIFPFATRCTVHPKRDQIAVPMCQDLPWNGCGVWDGHEVKVSRFHELPRNVIAKHPDGWEHPFVFELERKPQSKTPEASDACPVVSV